MRVLTSTQPASASAITAIGAQMAMTTVRSSFLAGLGSLREVSRAGSR